jgi:hypothetical protein
LGLGKADEYPVEIRERRGQAAGMSLIERETMSNSLVARKLEFIGDEAVQRYLEFGRTTDVWDKHNTGSPWDSRIIHFGDMPAEMEESIVEILAAVKEEIKAEYKLSNEIYPDDFTLVRWLTNDDHEPHADSVNPGGQPHPFHWRKYTAIIYLNRDFEGGDLCFPNQKIRMKPVPKSLAFFPGTLEYLHEVEKITAGTRYTLASFWTDDRTKSIYPKIFAGG